MATPVPRPGPTSPPTSFTLRVSVLRGAWLRYPHGHPERPRNWRLPSARLPRLDPELVVIVTGAGSNQKRTPRGHRLRGHHWPERWVTDRAGQRRMPELFVTGELLAAGRHAVLEVILHEGTHALAVVRGTRGTRTWVLDAGARGSMVRSPHRPMAWPPRGRELLAVLAPRGPGPAVRAVSAPR